MDPDMPTLPIKASIRSTGIPPGRYSTHRRRCGSQPTMVLSTPTAQGPPSRMYGTLVTELIRDMLGRRGADVAERIRTGCRKWNAHFA